MFTGGTGGSLRGLPVLARRFRATSCEESLVELAITGSFRIVAVLQVTTKCSLDNTLTLDL